METYLREANEAYEASKGDKKQLASAIKLFDETIATSKNKKVATQFHSLHKQMCGCKRPSGACLIKVAEKNTPSGGGSGTLDKYLNQNIALLLPVTLASLIGTMYYIPATIYRLAKGKESLSVKIIVRSALAIIMSLISMYLMHRGYEYDSTKEIYHIERIDVVTTASDTIKRYHVHLQKNIPILPGTDYYDDLDKYTTTVQEYADAWIGKWQLKNKFVDAYLNDGKITDSEKEYIKRGYAQWFSEFIQVALVYARHGTNKFNIPYDEIKKLAVVDNAKSNDLLIVNECYMANQFITGTPTKTREAHPERTLLEYASQYEFNLPHTIRVFVRMYKHYQRTGYTGDGRRLLNITRNEIEILSERIKRLSIQPNEQHDMETYEQAANKLGVENNYVLAKIRSVVRLDENGYFMMLGEKPPIATLFALFGTLAGMPSYAQLQSDIGKYAEHLEFAYGMYNRISPDVREQLPGFKPYFDCLKRDADLYSQISHAPVISESEQKQPQPQPQPTVVGGGNAITNLMILLSAVILLLLIITIIIYATCRKKFQRSHCRKLSRS